MMTEVQRRAARATAARMHQLGMTARAVAEAAGVHPATLSAFLNGHRWPRQDTRDRICRVLGWAPGEMARRGVHGDGLARYPLDELLDEIRRRCVHRTMRDVSSR